MVEPRRGRTINYFRELRILGSLGSGHPDVGWLEVNQGGRHRIRAASHNRQLRRPERYNIGKGWKWRRFSGVRNLPLRWEKPDAAAFLAVGLVGEDAGYITRQCRLDNRDKNIL